MTNRTVRTRKAAAMLMHDDHLLTYDLELFFLRNDFQAASVVPSHQDGTDIIHAGHRPFRSGRRCLNVIHALDNIRDYLPKTMDELRELMAGLGSEGFRKA